MALSVSQPTTLEKTPALPEAMLVGSTPRKSNSHHANTPQSQSSFLQQPFLSLSPYLSAQLWQKFSALPEAMQIHGTSKSSMVSRTPETPSFTGRLNSTQNPRILETTLAFQTPKVIQFNTNTAEVFCWTRGLASYLTHRSLRPEIQRGIRNKGVKQSSNKNKLRNQHLKLQLP